MDHPPSLRNSIASFGLVQVVIRTRGLILIPLLSRLIGAEGYGVIAALSALSAIGSNLVLVGVNTSITVLLPTTSGERRVREFWSVVHATTVSGVGSFALALIGYPLLASSLLSDIGPWEYVFGMLAMPLTALQAVLVAYFVSQQAGRSLANLVAIGLVPELGLVWIGATGWGVGGALAALALALAVQNMLLALAIVRREGFASPTRETLVLASRYYRYGLPVAIGGIAAWIIDASDRLVIAGTLSLAELGVYQAAYGFAFQITQLSAPIFAALMPLLVDAVSANDTNRTRGYLRSSFRLLAMIYVPIVLAAALVGGDVLTMLTTPAFAGTGLIIGAVALGAAFQQMAALPGYVLYAHHRGSHVAWSLGLAAVVNLGLNLALVPRFGITAAAISTTIAYAAYLAILAAIARRIVSVGFDARIVGALLICCAPAIGVAGALKWFDVAPGLFVLATVLSLVAALGLLAGRTGAITRDERDAAIATLRGMLPGRARVR